MNIQGVSRLFNQPVSEIFELTGRTDDIKPTDVNPFYTPQDADPPEYITVAEAVKRTGLSSAHIYKLMAEGVIDYHQNGSRKYPYLGSLPTDSGRTRAELVDRWMEEDPELRLHILTKYGTEEILQRINELCLS